jgi:hypothetical protein
MQGKSGGKSGAARATVMSGNEREVPLFSKEKWEGAF